MREVACVLYRQYEGVKFGTRWGNLVVWLQYSFHWERIHWSRQCCNYRFCLGAWRSVIVIVSFGDGNERGGEWFEMKIWELEWKIRLSLVTLISCYFYLIVWHTWEAPPSSLQVSVRSSSVQSFSTLAFVFHCICHKINVQTMQNKSNGYSA